MAELIDEPPQAPAAAPADGAAPTGDEAHVPASRGSVDLVDVLAEFDRAVPSPKTAPRASTEASPPAAATDADKGAAANAELAELREWAKGIEAERLQAREQADIGWAIGKAKAAISKFVALPADYAESFMTNRWLMDPAFKAAWDGRYASDEAIRYADRMVERAVQALVKSAETIPDRDATEDRAAVSAAVRGSSYAPPPTKPPDYSRMSNREFGDAVEKQHGFRPIGT